MARRKGTQARPRRPADSPHPKHDGSVYINPDGKGQWWDHLAEDVECPIVLEVWTNVNVWDESEESDGAYNYVDLVEKAFERIGKYIDAYTCPDDCRFKEFYREPGVGLHIETSCSKLTHGVVYTASSGRTSRASRGRRDPAVRSTVRCLPLVECILPM